MLKKGSKIITACQTCGETQGCFCKSRDKALDPVRKIAAMPEEAFFESTVRMIKREAQNIVEKLS